MKRKTAPRPGPCLLSVALPRDRGESFDRCPFSVPSVNDSIGAGQINRIEIPHTIVVRGYEQMAVRGRQFVDQAREVIDSLRGEGWDVELRSE